MGIIAQVIGYFHKGGFVMYILLLCSIFVISIGIERAIYFSKEDSGRKFADSFYRLMATGKLSEAKALAGKTKGALAILLNAGIERMQKGLAVTNFFEIQSGIALAKFRRRLYYLSVVVTMAPLLGLLGTISGMISSFSVFNLQDGQASTITGGIGEALIATAMGLCVAIISLVIHAYFSQRVDNIVTDMEQTFSLVEAARGDKHASA